MVILCLDYGDRYVGVAKTDPEGRIPLRYGIIDQKAQSLEQEIRAIVKDEEIGKIIVGLPISLSGNKTEQTHKTLAFIEDVKRWFADMDIEKADETLTSVEAARLIRAEGGNSKNEHAEAARLILAGYLSQTM